MHLLSFSFKRNEINQADGQLVTLVSEPILLQAKCSFSPKMGISVFVDIVQQV